MIAKKVLTVDDSTDITLYLRLLLKSWGLEVESARSGQEALEKYQSFQPEVVIVDIGLPDMDGLDLARELRKLAPNNERPNMYVLSGHSEPEFRERSLGAGYQDYLVKPIETSRLKALLRA